MDSVQLNIDQKIGSGAYADTFRDATRVFKLFTSGQHATNVAQGLTRPEDKDRRHKVFLSECEAYRRASAHPFLGKHIPQFFGPVTVADISGPTGSLANLYMLDHCYALEFIDGDDHKLGHLRGDNLPSHLRQALEAFSQLGIDHVVDASIFFPDDPDNFKFIDFAIEEFVAYW